MRVFLKIGREPGVSDSFGLFGEFVLDNLLLPCVSYCSNRSYRTDEVSVVFTEELPEVFT